MRGRDEWLFATGGRSIAIAIAIPIAISITDHRLLTTDHFFLNRAPETCLEARQVTLPGIALNPQASLGAARCVVRQGSAGSGERSPYIIRMQEFCDGNFARSVVWPWKYSE
jgi:hypothetical protein